MDDRRIIYFVIALTACVLSRHPALGKESKATEVTPVEDSDGATFDLRYQLNRGTVLRYSVDHRAAVRTTIDETTQEAQTLTSSVKAWKVTDVLPNGEIEIMNVVEQVHMQNKLPDRAPTEYDSQKDKTPPPGYEDAAKAIGVPLSVVRMTPRGEVISHKPKLQQPAAESDAPITVRLPDDPVAIGATWDEPFDVNVQVEEGGTKAIQTRRHYKLADVATGIATIEVTYQVLSPITPQVEAQLVQRLMKGTVKFDVEQGQIVSQTYEVDERVLGFAGPTSSMHYVMQMEETLKEAKVSETVQKTARNPVPPKPPTSMATRPGAKSTKVR